MDAAYFRKLSELKPLPGLMQENLESVLVAYETLSDLDSRSKYDKSLASGNDADEVEEIVRNMTQHQPILEQRGTEERAAPMSVSSEFCTPARVTLAL